MTRAGKLRHRVSLQEFTTTVDEETGNRERTWTEVRKLWAAVEPLSGREFVSAAASQSKVTTRITILYRSGITHEMRVVYRGKIYNIEAVLSDQDSGVQYLTLPCSQEV